MIYNVTEAEKNDIESLFDILPSKLGKEWTSSTQRSDNNISGKLIYDDGSIGEDSFKLTFRTHYESKPDKIKLVYVAPKSNLSFANASIPGEIHRGITFSTAKGDEKIARDIKRKLLTPEIVEFHNKLVDNIIKEKARLASNVKSVKRMLEYARVNDLEYYLSRANDSSNAIFWVENAQFELQGGTNKVTMKIDLDEDAFYKFVSFVSDYNARRANKEATV